MPLSDDPARDFARYDVKQTEWLNSLPECDICGQPIQQERAFHMDGFWICDECIEFYRKEVTPYE